MNKKEILSGIKGYSHEQEILLRVIRKSPEGLSDDKFDKLFSEYKETMDSRGHTTRTRRRPKLRFGWPKGSFILGNLSPSCEWERWMHLLGLMCHAGLVTESKEGGHVIYRIP